MRWCLLANLRNSEFRNFSRNSVRCNSSTTGGSAAAGGAGGDGAQPKLSLFGKFKAMYRDYWYVLMPVHIVTSIGWFGSFYQMSKSGVDVGRYMRKVGVSDSIVEKVTSSGAGHIAIAYALYKVATPVRYAVTLGGTTVAINRLRNMGYIKPAKEIYTKGRDKLQDVQNKLQAKGKN